MARANSHLPHAYSTNTRNWALMRVNLRQWVFWPEHKESHGEYDTPSLTDGPTRHASNSTAQANTDAKPPNTRTHLCWLTQTSETQRASTFINPLTRCRHSESCLRSHRSHHPLRCCCRGSRCRQPCRCRTVGRLAPPAVPRTPYKLGIAGTCPNRSLSYEPTRLAKPGGLLLHRSSPAQQPLPMAAVPEPCEACIQPLRASS